MREQREQASVKYSVIVPVYNCEEKLHACLNSIIEQDYPNWELILIDDGSTDRSFQVCQNYSEHDSRIIVEHQENRGPAAARNMGLERASGDYVLFCDADDYLERNAFSAFRDIKENVDIVFFSYADTVLENGLVLRENTHKMPSHFCDSNKEFRDLFMELDRQRFTYPVWNKLFKRSFLDENNARFPTGISVAEDFLFNIPLYVTVERVKIIETCLYHYCHNPVSLTTQFDKEKLNSVEYVYKYSKRILSTWCPLMVPVLENRYINDLSVYVNNMYNKDTILTHYERRELIKAIYKMESVNECIANIKTDSFRNAVFCFLMKHHLSELIMLSGWVSRNIKK